MPLFEIEYSDCFGDVVKAWMHAETMDAAIGAFRGLTRVEEFKISRREEELGPQWERSGHGRRQMDTDKHGCGER